MNHIQGNFQRQSSPGAPARLGPQAAKLILVALAYWVAVRLGLLLVAQPEGIATIWPASGLALAVLLLNPKRQWSQLLAAIFVANTAGNLGGGNTLPVSLGFALANTLEVTPRRLGADPFVRIKDHLQAHGGGVLRCLGSPS